MATISRHSFNIGPYGLISFSHTQFQLATLNINKEPKTVESSKLYYLKNSSALLGNSHAITSSLILLNENSLCIV
jgi:hypothetical protein